MSEINHAALREAKCWRRRLCWTCLGMGGVYQPLRRAFWPCPHCEGEAHPILALAEAPDA